MAGTVADHLLMYQTRLQGVAGDLALQLGEIFRRNDKKIAQTLTAERSKRQEDIRREMQRLAKLIESLEGVRAEAVGEARAATMETSRDLIHVAADSERIRAELNERTTKFNRPLTKEQTEKILKYQPFDGQSIGQWFDSLKTADLQRITQGVQRAAMDGLSVDGMVKMIRGTRENNYTDGILNTTRTSAGAIARTVINGVSNSARLEMIMANADVIDGVEFLATLDGRTCPECAQYDGRAWGPSEYDMIVRPPLHRNCRCTVIPTIGEPIGTRPAANADFESLAETEYNRNARENGGKRRWDDLSASTRKKYYYQAQKDYTARTGNAPYRQVDGKINFRQYFEQQDEAFRRSWLGAKRYDLYKRGSLTLDQLVAPDSGYTYTLDDLRRLHGNGPDGETFRRVIPDPSPTSIQYQRQKPIGDVEFAAQRGSDDIRRAILKGMESEHSENPELISAIHTIFDVQKNPDFWFANRDLSAVDIADVIRNGVPRDVRESIAEADRTIARHRSGVGMTAKEVLDRVREDVAAINAKIAEIRNDPSMTESEVKVAVKPLKSQRDGVVREAWLRADDPHGAARAELSRVPISNERFVRRDDGMYIDLVERLDGKLRVVSEAKAKGAPLRGEDIPRDGIDFVGRACDNLGLRIPENPELSVHGVSSRGCFLEKGDYRSPRDMIVLDSGRDNVGGVSGTAAHEFAHYVESKVSGLTEKVESFYREITTDAKSGMRFPEQPVPRSDGTIPHGSHEKYRKANIPIPVPENDDYKNVGEYTLREYGDGKHHELLSMFFQMMFSNPYRVVSEYPEFFERMMQCLK